MDQTVVSSPHPPRSVVRKVSREPPPSYEIATGTYYGDGTDDPVTEDTPLLETSHSPPPSPRRPHRLRREGSHTEPITGALRHPGSPPPPTPDEGYFQPLIRKEYWKAAFHLAVINFPFALGAWIYLFVGTLVGTTLLLTLPFGVLIWWGTLIGARALARWELVLQHKFHVQNDFGGFASIPYRYQPSIISQTHSPLVSSLHLEAGSLYPERDAAPTPPAYRPSFLQRTYAMFLDPASYQPLFYFIVIKGTTTLLMTPIIVALLPVSIVLVVPAPLVLRAIRRVGIWQADLAFEALDWVVVHD